MTFPRVSSLYGEGQGPELLGAFVADLYQYGAHTNLTAVPPDEAEARHLLDSLAVSPLVPAGSTVLDIGTGAGFPAWPLAWARPDLMVTAMDSTEKRLRFLARHPLPNLSLLLGRAEVARPDRVFSFVTGRAVAPLGIQAELSAAWTEPGGLFVPFRTPAERGLAENVDLAVLGLALEGLHEVDVPGTGVTRLFPMYRRVGPAAPGYPRPWSQIKARPLG